MAFFRCSRPECGEIVVVSGDNEIVVEFEPEVGQVYGSKLYPRSFFRAPPLLQVSKDWPETVQGHLRQAFSTFWSDLDACANRLRAAVEALLGDCGIRRFRVTSKPPIRRVRLSLHDRIQDFSRLKPELAALLMGVKWIGNYGSHELAAISRQDIFDGLDLLEHVLQELGGHSKKLNSLASKISKRKGPLSKKWPKV